MRTKFPKCILSRWVSAVALAMLLGPAGIAAAQEPATPAPAPQTAPAATPPVTDPTTPTAVAPAAPTPAAEQIAPAAPGAATAKAPLAVAGAQSGTPAKPEAKKSHFLVKAKKEKPPKMIPVTIERGVLTVDGWTGKAQLNYSIMDLKFIYLWAPGIGTAIVSSEPFGKAQLQAGAFNGHTLTVNVAGHTLQVASDHDLLSGKELIKPAYVLLDTSYVPANSNYPQFGYGVSANAPYAWPASLANYTGDVSRSPPLPKSLLPTLKTNCTPVTTVAKTDASKTDAAKADVVKTDPAKTPCTGAPMVMYPVKETKQEKAAVKKEEKKGEKVDQTYK